MHYFNIIAFVITMLIALENNHQTDKKLHLVFLRDPMSSGIKTFIQLGTYDFSFFDFFFYAIIITIIESSLEYRRQEALKSNLILICNQVRFCPFPIQCALCHTGTLQY